MGASDRDRWNDKWAERGVGTSHGSQLVELIRPHLPSSGRLLDIAGGGSPDSLTLARIGLDVTVCDVSDVGLIQARQRALSEDIIISTVEADLDVDPVPPGPWDVITVANYLNRDLFPALVAELPPGGILAVVIATVTNLERSEKPGRRFLLERSEILGLATPLNVIHHSEEWRSNNRHECHLVASR
ncbi:MAG: class I SAM-dependent methyltransferase [Acidimicrobiaceae bacterium]|jgi:tellurite methyltransferase|nr:class I SAM-dependent methyltransferase [Acidimicrobiaceae bacterium]MBT5850734.1 class I SAM-dependent methyltransferase [Acidimicrobiaceae bacterium]